MQVAKFISLSASKVSRGRHAKAKPLVAAHRCFALAVAIAASSWCAAQEAATAFPAPRDTITLQSGYFSSDYANNVDYAQFVLEQSRGTERLARWVYESNRDKFDSQTTRTALFVGANIVNFLGNSSLAYHEWGHASRMEAGGQKAHFFTSFDAIDPAPSRSFLGYAGNMLFKFSGATGPVDATSTFKANQESGRARDAIVDGAGVNNEVFLAERNDEQYFLKGHVGVFGIFNSENRFAIASYVTWGPDLPGNDMNNITRVYRQSGVDRNIQADDLRKINLLSAFSGAVVSDVLARRDFIVEGKIDAQPWLIHRFLVPNQYNYLSSRGITRKWVSGYAFNESLKVMSSYESVVRGDDYSEFGFGAYKDFGTWDVVAKVTGKDFDTLNLEAAASTYVAKDWKLGLKAYVWDSRSLLGERNTLDFSKNKTQQLSVALSYVY